ANDLHFELFPAEQGLLDKELFGRGSLEAATADAFELFAVIGDTAATSTHGEAGTNHHGEARRAAFQSNATLHFPCLVHRVRHTGFRRLETDFGHGLLELLAIFSLFDCVLVGADEFYAMLGKHPMADQ